MATKRISLNTLISTAMHSPRTESGFVLYPKVDGFSGQMEGTLTKAEQDPIFINKSKTFYNSATNIRRLWITGKRVRVQYFGLPKVGNKKTEHVKTFQFSKSMYDVADDILNYPNKYSKYLMEKNINKDAKAPDKYIVDGNVVGVLTSPYTCNNIEEVYIDWTMFMSEDVAAFFPALCNDRAISMFKQKATSFAEEKSDELLKYFNHIALSGVKNIRSRFPRLRLICMISNLDDIISGTYDKIPDFAFNNLEQEKETWYNFNKQLIAQSNSMVMMSLMTSDLKFLNRSFTVKNSQYKYDDEILNPLVTAHIKKIEDSFRAKTYGTSSEQENNNVETDEAVTSAIELKLIELEKKYGEKAIKNILLSSVYGFKKSDLQSVFDSMTNRNKKRYASMIGFSIG